MSDRSDKINEIRISSWIRMIADEREHHLTQYDVRYMTSYIMAERSGLPTDKQDVSDMFVEAWRLAVGIDVKRK